MGVQHWGVPSTLPWGNFGRGEGVWSQHSKQ